MHALNLPFYTTGHSNRSIDEFMAMLAAANIELISDIRKMPMSRANPQFNQDALAASLADAGIAYEHAAALDGLRGKTPVVPAEVNGLWRNASFHRYADYALTEPFRAGLEHVVAQGRTRRCALMCSEAVWWRCHRRIVADYLLARGEPVLRIMGAGREDPAHLTPGTVVESEAVVLYPMAPQS
jgi:uncharacterized protein (DUF488 family)